MEASILDLLQCTRHLPSLRAGVAGEARWESPWGFAAWTRSLPPRRLARHRPAGPRASCQRSWQACSSFTAGRENLRDVKALATCNVPGGAGHRTLVAGSPPLRKVLDLYEWPQVSVFGSALPF
jgi:hypothetical protein